MKKAEGYFTQLDGEEFYKIQNYDAMEDFFMTITSSGDVWNFCWSQGGITAGRVNANKSIFPYATCDKVSDYKNVTGSFTYIAVKENGSTKLWQPFESFLNNQNYKTVADENIERNIYKNANGTKVWFEEINKSLELSFRYGWTSSSKYGLVKMSVVKNLSSSKKEIAVLDGCANILPACIDADTQNANSTLVDAYKKTELNSNGTMAFFTMSSVLTDKAEPSEGLLANTSWFTGNKKIILNPKAPAEFFASNGDINALSAPNTLKGDRPSAYMAENISLNAAAECTWSQVFDTFLDQSQIVDLEKDIANGSQDKLAADIKATDDLMTAYLAETDGIQHTAKEMTCTHHRANVMFNIMRGGFFADNGKINVPDLIAFAKHRNAADGAEMEKVLKDVKDSFSVEKPVLEQKIYASNNKQLQRLFMEYLPMIFSRRHGDPSRPWNRFNIILNDNSGNPILNYEGNWRDIFQNWEPLAISYPEYIKNFTAKFLNAMTADGFNPYRISRDGIDWECPEPDNPWAQYGYWGDHQVIYLQKLLELWAEIDRTSLEQSLAENIYSSSNIPYRLKTYKEILEDPRNTIDFDYKLSDKLKAESKKYGTDRKLILDKNDKVALVSLTSKLLQIVIAKSANLVPDGGIWMNTQRPEWNDANNALAGWGLSVVTLNYFHRMLEFLVATFNASTTAKFSLPKAQAKAITDLAAEYKKLNALYADAGVNDKQRKTFTDACGLIFQKERDEFYKNGYDKGYTDISKTDLVDALKEILAAVKKSIAANKRSDNLYHTYNTLLAQGDKMKVLPLQEMLEGQVAALSSGLLTPAEVLELYKGLRSSALYEQRQNSYILYPNKNLTFFMDKNNVTEKMITPVAKLVERSNGKILAKDSNGVYHFNPSFKNARIMSDFVNELPAAEKPTEEELKSLCAIYEGIFNHQSFTGRSGTFYAYEGLGSIYWHMVSKLLLAVQENYFTAVKNGDSAAEELCKAYYEIQGGLSFSKTPEIYGAFPSDPYSHTPYLKGAKQPGMTGQVKEEVLARWGELGVSIKDSCAVFNPTMLKDEEYMADGTLDFTWCAKKVTYKKASAKSVEVKYADGSAKTFEGTTLPADVSRKLFTRSAEISEILVNV